jgi:hypothetical protein
VCHRAWQHYGFFFFFFGGGTGLHAC